MGIMICVYGTIYSWELLDVLYGSKWNSIEVSRSLQLYMVYVYIMGINGITECFLLGTIKQH